METSGLIKKDSQYELVVSQEDASQRIDKYLAGQFPLYSRTFFQELIKNGHASLNNKKAKRPKTIVEMDNIVTIEFPQKSGPVEKKIPKDLIIPIVHKDEHFLIINKPSGLLVHPTSPRDMSVTLIDWILHTFNDIANVGYVDRPGIVHRLDRGTSGLLIIPRTNHAHTIFTDMFKTRTIQKTYLAVVHGHPPKEGSIDFSIGRNPVQRKKMKTFACDANPSGIKTRQALTHYKVIEYFENSALVEVKPVSGRTHQIRVHFAALGHYLLGDILYGQESKMIKRHALHAYALSFPFDEKNFLFEKEAPADFKKLLTRLRQ